MHKVILLSYSIDEATPVYPGTPSLMIMKAKEIKNSDSCNTFSVTLSDHSGTHIETPRHFFDSGKSLKSYAAYQLAFKNPVIIDCPKRPGEMIESKDLSGISFGKDTDALLARTGFYKYRSSDAAAYCNNNPSLSPEAARWIRQNLLNLKIFGVDSISISSKARMGLGAEAHRILLTDEGYGGDPVLILEDLYLPDELTALDELREFPVFSADIDSSPCAVIGILND